MTDRLDVVEQSVHHGVLSKFFAANIFYILLDGLRRLLSQRCFKLRKMSGKKGKSLR